MNVLVTGDYTQAEFRDAIVTQTNNVHLVDWDKVRRTDLRGVDLVVVAQSRRGQFRDSEFKMLSEKYPLAARVVVFGAWCEGETRSGAPVEGIHRVYLRDWLSTFDNLKQAFSDRNLANASLAQPSTNNRADEVQNLLNSSQENLPPLNIGIYSIKRDFIATISDFATSRNWKVQQVEFPNSRKSIGPSLHVSDEEFSRKTESDRSNCLARCDLLIFDCQYSVIEAAEFAGELNSAMTVANQTNLNASRFPPVIAVVGFPRQQDRELLRKANLVFEIVGKPFGNEILERSAMRLIQNRSLSIVTEVA